MQGGDSADTVHDAFAILSGTHGKHNVLALLTSMMLCNFC